MTQTNNHAFTRIRVDWTHDVTHVTLNRPERRNAIDLRLAQELLEACVDERTTNSRCVLLDGTGDHFCTGGDLKSFRTQPNLPNHLIQVTSYLHAAIVRLAAMQGPLVVAACGHVAGAGLGLACLADVLLTAEGATYRTAYGAIGLTPDASTSHLLPQLVGLRRAQRMTLLGHVVDAKEAERWGLSSETVPAGLLPKRAWEVAFRIAAGPTVAYKETSRLLRSAFARPLGDQLDDETRTLSAVATTADAEEGVSAFIDRRSAVFGGRR